MWYVSIQGRKIKTIKVFCCSSVIQLLSTCVELLIIQKQLAPEFLSIHSLYCCNKLVSNCDKGFVVQLLVAAINLLPVGVLYILGSQ